MRRPILLVVLLILSSCSSVVGPGPETTPHPAPDVIRHGKVWPVLLSFGAVMETDSLRFHFFFDRSVRDYWNAWGFQVSLDFHHRPYPVFDAEVGHDRRVPGRVWLTVPVNLPTPFLTDTCSLRLNRNRVELAVPRRLIHDSDGMAYRVIVAGLSNEPQTWKGLYRPWGVYWGTIQGQVTASVAE